MAASGLSETGTTGPAVEASGAIPFAVAMPGDWTAWVDRVDGVEGAVSSAPVVPLLPGFAGATTREEGGAPEVPGAAAGPKLSHQYPAAATAANSRAAKASHLTAEYRRLG